jgi:hypothetical protein
MRTQTRIAIGFGIAAPLATATALAAVAYHREHAEVVGCLERNEEEFPLRPDPRTNDCLEAVQAAAALRG